MKKTGFRNFAMRSIAILILLFSTSKSLTADLTVEQRENEDGSLTVYQLTVTPAGESIPALKNRLTIEPYRTVAGNAATHYLRSFGEHSLESPWNDASKKFGEDFNLMFDSATSIAEIPIDNLREVSGYFDSYIKNHIRRATECRDCEWGLAEEQLRGRETLEFMLPSVQQTRTISRVLALRTRLAIAEGRFGDAIDHLRMNYQLGRNVSKMGFLVTTLVGIAEIGISNNGMLELIATKDAPNMYWPLAELPVPIIDIRDAIRLEMSIGIRLVPELMDVAESNHTSEEWNRLLASAFDRMLQPPLLTKPTVGSRIPGVSDSSLLAFASGLTNYTAAKARLIESDYEASLVAEMPVGQVLLIDAANEYQQFADAQEKTALVPVSQAGRYATSTDELLSAQALPARLGRFLALQVLPSTVQIRMAQVRVQREIGVLQLIESIRMHAAETGSLPETLDDIRVVPVPKDPLTETDFVYRLRGDKAVIELPSSDYGSGFAARYEIKLAQ